MEERVIKIEELKSLLEGQRPPESELHKALMAEKDVILKILEGGVHRRLFIFRRPYGISVKFGADQATVKFGSLEEMVTEYWPFDSMGLLDAHKVAVVDKLLDVFTPADIKYVLSMLKAEVVGEGAAAAIDKKIKEVDEHVKKITSIIMRSYAEKCQKELGNHIAYMLLNGSEGGARELLEQLIGGLYSAIKDKIVEELFYYKIDSKIERVKAYLQNLEKTRRLLEQLGIDLGEIVKVVNE